MIGTCKTCAHRATAVAPDKTLVQNCKRFPPTVVVVVVQDPAGMRQQPTAVYPGVDLDDRCGEWSARDSGPSLLGA